MSKQSGSDKSRHEPLISVCIFALSILVTAVIPLAEERRTRLRYLGSDKLLHLLTHAGLTASLATVIEQHRDLNGVAALLAVATSIGYGIAIEYLQEAVPGREFEFADIVADTVGSFIGIVLLRVRYVQFFGES